MEKVILNETPVRTSKSFGINNIQLETLEIPEAKEFTNTSIKSSINVENKKAEFELEYEIESKLTWQLQNNANQNIFINIPEGVALAEPIEINFKLTSKQNVLVDNIFINANNNSKAEIIIKYECDGEDFNGFHNGACNVVTGENANIKVIAVNVLNGNIANYFVMNNKIGDFSNLEYVVVDFGGEKSVTNYYSNLEGKEANAQINTMYLGRKEQLIDINYITEVYGPKSNIDIEVYGALKENSKKNFKGTIDFKKGCKKATGNENEYCMLLSKTARAKALPMLLCREDDVQGNHSNSAGKIDEDKLYYIMSRGIPNEDAKKLIVKAKFNSIINKIELEELKAQIIDEIDKRL